VRAHLAGGRCAANAHDEKAGRREKWNSAAATKNALRHRSATMDRVVLTLKLGLLLLACRRGGDSRYLAGTVTAACASDMQRLFLSAAAPHTPHAVRMRRTARGCCMRSSAAHLAKSSISACCCACVAEGQAAFA